MSGRMVRSSPTMAPTKALTRTSKPNCCQFAWRPSRTVGISLEFNAAFSRDGTAIGPGLQIGRIPFRPEALFVELNDSVVVGRSWRNSIQDPVHKVTNREPQVRDPLANFSQA